MRPTLIRTLFLFGFVVLVMVAASDCAGLARAERLRAQVPALDVGDIATARTEFRRVGGVSPIAFIGRARLARALRRHLIALADRAILDYRTDAPPVGETQWQQALESLDFAAEVAPGDGVVAAKRAYVRGHLARIGKRVDDAIRYFRESARLDGGSPDPYLGLATMSAYSTRDLDALTEAVQSAEARGYTRGRRERVEFGDLHRYLGDRARAAATGLSGSERIEQLEHAVGDYEKCIEYFDGLRFLNSEANLRNCRRRLAQVKEQLPAPVPDLTLELEPSEL